MKRTLVPWIAAVVLIMALIGTQPGSRVAVAQDELPDQTFPVTVDPRYPYYGEATISGENLTYSVATPPANGTVTLLSAKNDGKYIYEAHDPSLSGDTFTLDVKGRKGTSAVVTVILTYYIDTTVPPDPQDQTFPVTIDPRDTYIGEASISGEGLIYAVETPPVNGTVTLLSPTNDGKYTYDAFDPSLSGDMFTLRVTAPNGSSALVTVILTYYIDTTVPPDPQDQTFEVYIDPKETYIGVATISGDDLTYVIETPPVNGKVTMLPESGTGWYAYEAKNKHREGDTFTLRVTAPNGASALVTVNLIYGASPGQQEPNSASTDALPNSPVGWDDSVIDAREPAQEVPDDDGATGADEDDDDGEGPVEAR